MTPNLKALGVIAAAALVMSAVFASAAQAETLREFKSGETPETHTSSTLEGVLEGGVENNYFQTEHPSGPKVTCTTAGITLAGEVAEGTANTLTLTPSYTGCWQIGTTRNGTVSMNECKYTLEQPTEIAATEFTGKASLYCPEGQQIEARTFSADGVEAHGGTHGFEICNMTIRPVNENTEEVEEQELGGHIVYTNLPNHEVTEGIQKDAVTAEATIGGIFWERHGLCGNAEGHDGTYRSQVLVTGASTEGGKHHDIWIG